MYGTTDEDEDKYGTWFEGVIPNLERRWENTTSEYVKDRLHGYLSEQPCRDLQRRAAAAGGRSRSRIGGKNIQRSDAG